MNTEAHWYYSDALTNDTEGNLVQLCDKHAHANKKAIEWASEGDADTQCELCS